MCRRALVVLLLLAVMICGSAASAGASVTGVTLPMTLPGYMAVDDAHQQLFVSGSMTEATVKVIGFDGAAVGTITQQGASGLAIANGKLYVAGCGTDHGRDLRHLDARAGRHGDDVLRPCERRVTSRSRADGSSST